ncbi:hypothetical protein MJO28_001412 [Puccinia striiformis f. sp. tritici]|uniref:Mitochondrial carrier protein n=2 Tax=Puccinia striiformis f. sp. tritici TaxID=168172 RepID=A0A0L0VRN1_9BASI|nr:hypothetical protein Pst134EA_003320 [Puccinia striiformis f. sp. tritici]KAI9620100.1 hypothetical protein KEM48_008302 [Puccinia striiformis f. sp. tritici PST-130]KNF01665.1 hypothetical protein PSTG_05096 [Puccinia striiformis f. sp. tritici PST-78]KAH9464883.1 hypothetical protein Pst134EB_004388 [Puccinia striiformis f. sp. tritici]KAH9472713.1 hypothetical protein Pst134EA_003320 [Puccinia striiformis f. sp. tritici]KAI7960923.1 hypothetical protein MJO28_001412 [Puccinia striiformis
MRGLLKDLDDRGGGRWSYLIGTESIIAGAGAGLVSSVVTCPLDVVKTKLQAQGGGLFTSHQSVDCYEGLLGSMKIIWREEGFRGLYRGLGPTIIGYLPTWAIYFTVYDAAKARLADSRPNHKEDVVAHVLAAMTAGATSTIATNPLWLIKTRFMTQRVIRDPQSERYRHTFDAFKRIHAKEGIRGFYRGLVPSLFGVTHVAIQFPLYEQIKLYYQKETSNDLPSSQILMASAASKMLASLLTYPHEVLRTRLQVHVLKPANQSSLQTSSQQSKLIYPKLRDVLQIIIKNEGLAGLYHGMGVNLIRTVPSSALTILTYELLMRHLTSLTRHP